MKRRIIITETDDGVEVQELCQGDCDDEWVKDSTGESPNRIHLLHEATRKLKMKE